MLFSTSATFAALCLLGMTAATPLNARDDQQAYVTVEKYMGSAFGDVCQQTIAIPIGSVYTNADAFKAVSSLYVKGANGVDETAVTCTPYKNTDGTGSGGLPFTSTTPSRLSTNTVVVGSIVCKTN